MSLELLSRWSPDGLLPESTAENDLSRILEGGPGTNARAVFTCAEDWHDAIKAVAEEPEVIARSRLIIFPQVSVSQYRVDFMVVCAAAPDVRLFSSLSRLAFFVECDGRIGHAENGEQILADDKRERHIRRQTGLTMLRFSGAEVMYQPTEVDTVIGAQVEALAALREHGRVIEPIAETVLLAVARLSCHRAHRVDYTARNSERSQVDPYDPYGEPLRYEFPQDIEREAEWDSFLDLRMKVAQMRRAAEDACKVRHGYMDAEDLAAAMAMLY